MESTRPDCDPLLSGEADPRSAELRSPRQPSPRTRPNRDTTHTRRVLSSLWTDRTYGNSGMTSERRPRVSRYSRGQLEGSLLEPTERRVGLRASGGDRDHLPVPRRQAEAKMS
jgi:hypothetical protein